MAQGHDWLRVEEIELDLRLGSKRAVIDELARLLAARQGGARQQVFEELWRREALGSTALGRGVALPHARTAGLDSPLAAFVRLRQPVAFEAPDDKPVEFALGLLLPQRDPQRQLDFLAGIATRFSEPDFRSRLLDATTPVEVRRLLIAGVRP